MSGIQKKPELAGLGGDFVPLVPMARADIVRQGDYGVRDAAEGARSRQLDGLFHTRLDQNIDMNSPPTVGGRDQRMRMSTK